MFTPEEMETITRDATVDAINRILKNLMIYEGQIRVECMTTGQVDYAIHALRHHKVISSAVSPNARAAA